VWLSRTSLWLSRGDPGSIPRMETVARTVLIDQTLVVLWLTSKIDPPANDFERGIATIRQAMRDHGVPGSATRTVIVSDGGAPNAKQRKDLAELWSGAPAKSAVITTVLSNPIKRGIATALAWTNPAMKFFRPEEMIAALGHLGLEHAKATIWAEYGKLQTQVPRNATLGLIAEATGLPPMI
jgi:hypothetical protein